MACPRCHCRPVVSPRLGLPVELIPGGIEPSLLQQHHDIELCHAKVVVSAFLGGALQPAGYERPRICSLCSVVYYPSKA